MSNTEVVKAMAKDVVGENVTRNAIGGTMVKGGVIAGGIWLAAGLLPFVSFPLLIVLLVVGGLALRTL